jgi:hypothetical protein
MQFIKDFGRNLIFLIVIGIVLFIVAPGMMNQVFQLYGALFGPLIIVILVVAALPRRQRSRR